MDVRRRFLLAVLLLVGLLLAGTAGYMRIESWPLRDALYMSVITMSTVGFREIGHLSPAGEWFTIGYIFLSIMFAGFAVATITAFLVQGELRDVLKGRRMQKQIGNLRDHYILCGCGAVGREIVMEFLRARVPFVVVDQHPDEALIPRDQEVLLIPGDATDEETLQRAGVARARGLIAALRGEPTKEFQPAKTLPKPAEAIELKLACGATSTGLWLRSRWPATRPGHSLSPRPSTRRH